MDAISIFKHIKIQGNLWIYEFHRNYLKFVMAKIIFSMYVHETWAVFSEQVSLPIQFPNFMEMKK